MTAVFAIFGVLACALVILIAGLWLDSESFARWMNERNGR